MIKNSKHRKILKITIIITTVLIASSVAYGAYVTGGYVRFPDIFYAVTCSLTSFNGKYFTKIAITFDKSVFYYHNVRLSGFVEVSIMTPYGLYTWSYWLNKPKTICIDLSKAVNDLVKHYTESRSRKRFNVRFLGNSILSARRKFANNTISDEPLPTIWITFYMYDKHGHLYIGTFSYSTVNFLMITRKLPYGEAVREAIENPLQIFEQPLWIVVKGNEVDYTNMTAIFSNTMSSLVKSIYHTSLREKLLRGRFVNFLELLEEDHLLKNVKKIIKITSLEPPDDKPWPCLPDAVEVFWNQLYNAKNNPPKGWMSRVEYPVEDVKKKLWRIYATYYSLAYFYSKKYYTAKQALECVAYGLFGNTGLGPESAFPMQDLLNILSNIIGLEPEPTWKNIIKPGTVYHIKVPIGVTMIYQTDAPVEAYLSVIKVMYSTYQAGIAFLGYLILGTTNAIGTFKIRYGYADEGGPELYIIVPVTLQYVDDGASLVYYVTDATINGTEYWVIIPVSAFPIPYYMLENFDVSSARTVHKYPSELFRELVNWTSDKYKLVFRRLILAGTSAETILYNDSNVESWEESSWAGLVSNFLQPLLKTLIVTVFAPEDTLLALFYRIALTVFTFTYVNSKTTGIAIIFDVHTVHNIKHNFMLYVYKLNTKDQPIYIVKGHKYVPLMLQYYVIIQKPIS